MRVNGAGLATFHKWKISCPGPLITTVLLENELLRTHLIISAHAISQTDNFRIEPSNLTGNLPQKTSLHVGGVVAMGFSRDGNYLLVVSHSGRGVYSVCDWRRVARDDELSYPDNGEAIGIGPIAGERIQVTEMNYDTGELSLQTPDGRMQLEYESGTIDITLLET